MTSPSAATTGLRRRSAVGQVARTAIGTVVGVALVPVLVLALAAAPVEPAGP